MREENTPVDTSLAELAELQRILETAPAQVEHRTVLTVSTGGERFCVPVISMGVRDQAAPAVGFFGGVHGLERIGSGVVLACLRILVARLAWDVTPAAPAGRVARWCSCRSSIPAACGAAPAPIREAST